MNDNQVPETIESESREATTSGGWIRITQGMPPIGLQCFLHTINGIIVGSREEMGEGWVWSQNYGCLWHNGQKWDTDNEADDMEVLNWMPLPQPPTDL